MGNKSKKVDYPFTGIRITKSTAEKIKNAGKFGMSYEECLLMLLAKSEVKK